jgi:Asp-tRNA(Asn)/Glu-tRNA(Gln) amidotransferase A subunit family amidase
MVKCLGFVVGFWLQGATSGRLAGVTVAVKDLYDVSGAADANSS